MFTNHYYRHNRRSSHSHYDEESRCDEEHGPTGGKDIREYDHQDRHRSYRDNDIHRDNDYEARRGGNDSRDYHHRHHHHHQDLRYSIEKDRHRKKAPITNYYVPTQAKDENLPTNIQQDPRGDDPTQRLTAKATKRGAGRNTESFDPASTLVRPDVRILVGNPNHEKFPKPLKHDDVVIVPELFGPEDNWDIYYELVKEITELQQKQVKGSEFIPWHEGAHLICQSPDSSPKFQQIIKRLCQYFDIDAKSAGTRFNWYKDSSDWKPFHHDSAAFNPRRAKNQNITVGVSFGATRELAFIRATSEGMPPPEPSASAVRMYFPQTNNGVFTFGRDVNIHWKHGVNALPPKEQDGKGRISIILWGLARNVIEEDGSPPLLGSDGQGPHANHKHNQNRFHRDRDHGNKRPRNCDYHNDSNNSYHRNGTGGHRAGDDCR